MSEAAEDYQQTETTEQALDNQAPVDGELGDRGDDFTPMEERVEQEVAAEQEAAPQEAVQEEPQEIEEEPTIPSIPKTRFDEVNNRRKEAERELAEMRGRLSAIEDMQKQTPAAPKPEPAPVFDFDAKEQEYMDAVMDGDKDKALQLRRAIRQAESDVYKQQVLEQTQQASGQTREQIEFTSMAEKLTAKYDIFNPDSASYDQAVVDETLELQAAFVAKGMAPASALAKASGYTLQGYTNQTPEPVAPPPPKTTNVKKNVAAAKQQPPAMTAGQGNATTPTVDDIFNMSDTEFEKLTPEKLKSLRGDAL